MNDNNLEFNPFNTLRQDGRINITLGIQNGLIQKDEIENTGARNKFWFNNYEYLFKEIFEDSYEDFAVLLSFEIAKELNIECASYDLAIYNGKNGVITKNFVNEEIGEELISGTEVINEVYQKHILPLESLCNKYNNIIDEFNIDLEDLKSFSIENKKDLLKKLYVLYKNSQINSSYMLILDYDRIDELSENSINNYLKKIDQIFKTLSDMYESDFMMYKNGIVKANNLFDLWSVIDMYCKINEFTVQDANIIIKKLVDVYLYDIITSQGDRHSNNWGIIVNKNTMEIRLSPLYDNSNMCNLNRSKAIKAIQIYINNLNDKEEFGPKEVRTLNRLKEAIYHEKSSLKVIPEDGQNRSNNIKMINEFVNISAQEEINELLEKINKLSEENLNNMYRRIEDRIGIIIPNAIKGIVSKTIEININEIRRAINKEDVNGK